MRIILLYESETEQERSVLEYEKEYRYRSEKSLELYDINTKDGSAMASLYDIVHYPAILAVTGDGQVIQCWQGENLPLISEVSYYSQL